MPIGDLCKLVCLCRTQFMVESYNHAFVVRSSCKVLQMSYAIVSYAGFFFFSQLWTHQLTISIFFHNCEGIADQHFCVFFFFLNADQLWVLKKNAEQRSLIGLALKKKCRHRCVHYEDEDPVITYVILRDIITTYAIIITYVIIITFVRNNIT